jgi:hypothetical protein
MPNIETHEVERFWVESDDHEYEIVITDQFAEKITRTGTGTQSHFVSFNNRQARTADGRPVNINADGTFTLVTTGEVLKRAD